MLVPDGEGHFAFEGRMDGDSVETVRWVVLVERNGIDDQLYAHRAGGGTWQVRKLIGEWTRVALPWDYHDEGKDFEAAAVSIAAALGKPEAQVRAHLKECLDKQNIMRLDQIGLNCNLVLDRVVSLTRYGEEADFASAFRRAVLITAFSTYGKREAARKALSGSTL